MTNFTDGLGGALVDAVRQGVPFETAALAAGLSHGAIGDWVYAGTHGHWPDGSRVSERLRERLAAFSESIARAQAQWEAERVQNIVLAGQQVNEKTGQRDWRADAFLLNNHPRTRERYRQANQLQVQQETTLKLEYQRARALSDQELEQEYARVYALPAAEGQPDQSSTQAETG